MSNTVSDKSSQECSELISTGENIGKYSKFDRMAKPLNVFLKKFDMDKKYQNLAIIFQLIFVLSHGQASALKEVLV